MRFKSDIKNNILVLFDFNVIDVRFVFGTYRSAR